MGVHGLLDLSGPRIEWLASVANLQCRLQRIASRSEENGYGRASRCVFDKRDHRANGA